MFHLGAALLQNLAVSPELTLRPSLSVRVHDPFSVPDGRVSPELTLRPSLSARHRTDQRVSPLTLRPSLSSRS